MKTYIANTPLILEDDSGREYRVEAGEAVDLTPELYELVAAHVSEAEISAADLAASGYQADGETPLTQPETPSENLLYELMLRMGLKLTCKVSFSDDVYFVEDEDTGGLYAFLLERVDQGLIDAVLEKHPVKVAVLDRLFEDDDALKSNTVLQMKDAGVMFDCV